MRDKEQTPITIVLT